MEGDLISDKHSWVQIWVQMAVQLKTDWLSHERAESDVELLEREPEPDDEDELPLPLLLPLPEEEAEDDVPEEGEEEGDRRRCDRC